LSIATRSRQSFVFFVLVLSSILVSGVIASAKSTAGNPKAGCDEAHGSETGHGANQGTSYDSTCDGSGSQNGNGGGGSGGKPCAGCVGSADDKHPPGQQPGGSDANNGYECDGNGGVAKKNPAHTGCAVVAGSQSVPTPTPGGTGLEVTPTPGLTPTPGATEIPVESPGPTITPSVEPTRLTPAPTRRPSTPPTRPPGPEASIPPAVRGKRLPFTGGDASGALVIAGLLMALGGASMMLSYRAEAVRR